MEWGNFESFADDATRRINSQVWNWTANKMNYGADFARWRPAEHQIVALALQMGLTRQQADKNRMLLKIQIMDRMFCDACKNGEKLNCHMKGKPTVVVESQKYNGEFELGCTEPCNRYQR